MNLSDACPSCQPGIPDASPPVGPVTISGGVLITDHECPDCGTCWTAWRDGWGFLAGQMIAVSPEQSARAA